MTSPAKANAAPTDDPPAAAIGILMLDSRFERPPGDLGNAASWPFPVRYGVVRGASPSRVVREGAAGLLPDFIAAGRELVAGGAAAVATSCGFLSIFQREMAQALGVPVATSALLQVPWVQAMLAPQRRVGVITACAATLTPSHLTAAGAAADTPVAGLESGSELYRVLVAGEKDEIDSKAAQRDVLAAGRALLESRPEVAAIVLECTNLPPYAAALQATVGLPVYDVHSLITWLHAGLQPATFPGRR